MDETGKSLTTLIEDFTGDDEWGVQIGPSFAQKVASMQQPFVLILPPPQSPPPNVTYKKTQPICYPPRVSSNINICMPRPNNANRFCSKQGTNDQTPPPPPNKRVRRYQLTEPPPWYNNNNNNNNNNNAYSYLNINTVGGDDDNDDDDALLQQVIELSLRGDAAHVSSTNEKTCRYDNNNNNNTTSSCSTTTYQNVNDTVSDIDINPLDDPLMTTEEREAMRRAMDESAREPLPVDPIHEQALEEMRREWQRVIRIGTDHLQTGRPNNNHSVA